MFSMRVALGAAVAAGLGLAGAVQAQTETETGENGNQSAEGRYEIRLEIEDVKALSRFDSGAMGRADFFMVVSPEDGDRIIFPRVDNRTALTREHLEDWHTDWSLTCEAGERCRTEVTLELCDKDPGSRQDCDRADLTGDLGADDEGIVEITLHPARCAVTVPGQDAMDGEAPMDSCMKRVVLEGTGSGPKKKAQVTAAISITRD